MILLIGSDSFIGIHTMLNFIENKVDFMAVSLTDRLKDYYKDKGIKHVTLDLSNIEDIKKLPTEGVSGVILLAGLLPANVKADLINEEPAYNYFKINTLGTINLLEYCRKNNIERLISTASYADVYHNWTAEYPMSADIFRDYIKTGDHAVYVFSKNAAADTMLYYNDQYNMKNVIFRFPMVYGVGPHGSYRVNGKLIKSGFQIFLEAAMNGENITLFGDKNISRDVAYVKDVAEALRLAIGSEKANGFYNISGGESVSLDEQAKKIIKVFDEKGTSKVIYKPERTNTSKSFWFSIDKAKNDFGYNPKFNDFETMLRDYKEDLKDLDLIKMFKVK